MPRYIQISFASVLLLVVNFFVFQNSFFGGVVFFLSIFGLIIHLAKLFYPNKTSGERYLFSALFLFSMLTIVNSVLYYLYKITPTTSLLVFISFSLLFFIPLKKTELVISRVMRRFHRLSKYVKPFQKKYFDYQVFTFLALEIFLFFLVFHYSTTEILVSPWNKTTPLFFILYALTTFFLFSLILFSKIELKTKLVCTISHLFFTFSIAAIMYKLGYGYDGFIHRATEEWIQQNGFITPKNPYYIGQYSMIVWISNLSFIPIFFIDVYFVPFLAALSLPFATMYALKNIWDIPKNIALALTFVFPFLFFLSLQLTTPHNLLILLFLITILLSLFATKEKKGIVLLFLLCVTGMFTHPLLGAPLLIFIFTKLLLKKIPSIKLQISVIILFFLVITFLFTFLFALNNYLGGYGLPHIGNPITNFPLFLKLFQRPFWYIKNVSFIFDTLYFFQALIAPLVFLLAIYGLIKTKKFLQHHLLYLIGFVAFLCAAWFLHSSIHFEGLGAFEQGEYPMRLVKSSILFLLPFSMFGVYQLGMYLKKWKKASPIFLLFASFLVMLALYFAYPQNNPKVRFPGFNVTAHDFHAVEMIQKQAHGVPYITLSNSLVCAATLTKYGFIHYYDVDGFSQFYCSMPSGSPLYILYQKMVYEGTKREYMEKAMQDTGVDKAFFVINKYWSNFPKIVENAKMNSDAWFSVDNEELFVFEYDRRK